MSKLNPRNLVPDGYEVLETLVASGSAWEYLASHKADNTLVRLKVYSFADTTEATRHRHIRSYLRKDVGFMDELNHPGIIKLYDYSETRQLFWLAIQPTDVQKLSDVFSQIASLPLETKAALIEKLFSIIEYIHSREVVHRNLSSEGVYLGPKLGLYVGDFGLACYLEDASTSGYSTTSTSTLGAAYQAPEIKDAQTAFLDFRSDVFTAGLLAIEILCGKPVPKDTQKDFSKTLRQYLEQHGVVKYAGPTVCKVLLKAIRSDAEKRWVTIKDLSNAFAKALQDKSASPMTTVSLTGTVGITETLQPSHKVDGIIPTETISTEEESAEPPEAGAFFTPHNPQNEIWNNRYEIIEKIGGGGQAVVYKAFDHLTNEEIAIKTLLTRHRKDKHAVNRLKQEAMVARSLTHRYIIKTYSVEQRTGISHRGESVFLCMELITSGLELKDVISKRRASGLKFSVDEVLHITRQLLNALKYAHSFTVHRDIKPGNIMLVPHDGHSEDDTSDLTKFDIILMDFGIAKVLTQKRIEVTGKGFWSAHYGAPELADFKSTVDPRADLYSVGIIMYQMFTGHIPRKGSQSVNKVNKNVSTVLAKVINKAIDANREKRFKNAAVFIKEIDKAVSRFSWVLKTTKVVILLILSIILACMVLNLIDILSKNKKIVQEGINTLNTRAPSEVIASFANSPDITYDNLRGFESYNSFREATLRYLKGYQNPDKDMFPISYTSWCEQDKEWEKIKLLADKVKRIASFREGCADFEKLPVLEHLQELKPSSTFLEEIQKKTERAEKLLDKRPLSKDILEECENSYALIAASYGYIKRVDEKIINVFPKLQTLKQTHSNISRNITELESFTVESLSAIRGFNNNRRKVLGSFAVCNGGLAKLNESDIELACKTSVENTLTDIRKLIKRPDRTKLLWAFYAKNKNWQQWQGFFDVFHINIATNGTIQLGSLPQLELLNNHGSPLQQSEIVAKPQEFFYVDTDEPSNFAWPRYARAKDDPSIQFVFIPAKTDNSPPFYMATREITNAQYCMFLNKAGAQNTSKIGGWPIFADQSGKELISRTSFGSPPSGIKYDEPKKSFVVSESDKNIPVTWVTFHGADSYAKRFSGQLPTASQYKYACKGGADTIYPWGNNLGQIQLYAHVRANAWQHTASEYNSKINRPLEMAPPPLGALGEFEEDGTINVTKVLNKNTVYNSAWPLATTTKPNAWGLYDMIGNVWEWCIDDKDNTQSVICGGSCLAPPKYITSDSMYNFKGIASDVGFRIIIPAKCVKRCSK